MQNLGDTDHIRKHANPFIKSLNAKKIDKYSYSTNSGVCLWIKYWGKGHIVPDYEMRLNVIDKLIGKKNIEDIALSLYKSKNMITDFECLSVSELGQIGNDTLENLCKDLFIDNNLLFNSINKELFYGSKPVFSKWLNNNNYVYYEGDLNFWIVQRFHFCYCVIFLDFELIVYRGGRGVKLSSAINDVDAITQDGFIPLVEPKISLINGYYRPYHYFYDTLQTLEHSKISNFNEIIDLQEIAFLPSSILAPRLNNKVISVEELPAYLKNKNSVAIALSSVRPIKGLNFIKSFSDKIYDRVEATYKLSDEFVENNFIIWIGICQESRQWFEQQTALEGLINKIKALRKDVHFIFDGLTCPHYLNEDEYKYEYCTKEIELLEEIVKSTGLKSADFSNTIGAHAFKKIYFSKLVDFFITDALTDSIWPATFGKKPGVAYSIERSEIVQYHPNTEFVPQEHVIESGDQTGNWARVGFSIDPDFFIDFTISALEQKTSFYF
ncbi:hypothetical protein [Psychrobacter cibarius]|uniref:hypothetical protein n=1 Tax=Psychrobacter cibarius TaxID=282669 RepID=UPI00191A182B|nr:hypothetical protein [Psychrobacter cibarius]